MFGIILLFTHLYTNKSHKFLFFAAFLIPFLLKPNFLFYFTRCPVCFDDGLCEAFVNGNIQLYWVSKVLLILNPTFTKSVFFARINDSEDVVLKSMARRSQASAKLRNYTIQNEILKNVITENSLSDDKNIQNVVLCKNVKSLGLLFKTVDEDLFHLMVTKNLWLDIQISIEPLLLKFFSVIPGISVPRFFGACGDVIVKEYKGNALTEYYTHDWKQRVFLSIQLLKMAEALTFIHESLIFYFMDISPDNIAVDSLGKASLIDLDHVIIAERMIDQSSDSGLGESVHTSTELDQIKLAISPSDICKYAISDHNYFAICRYILFYSEEIGEGLLENIPERIHEKFPNFRELFHECATPMKYANRIVAGRLLNKVLTKIISGFKWEGK